MQLSTYSIQTRIIRQVLLSVVVLLTLSAGLIEYLIIDWLEQEFDETLLSKAGLLITLTKADDQSEHPSGIDFDFADEFLPEFGGDRDDYGNVLPNAITRTIPLEYFQLRFEDGTVFESSNSLEGNNLPVKSSESNSYFFENIVLPNGDAGRIVQVSFYPQIPEEEDRTPINYEKLPLMHFVVAKQLSSLNELTRLIQIGFVISILLFVMAAYLIITRSVKKAFKPIKALKNQLIKLEAKRLNQRIEIDNPPSEIESVIRQCNYLLERLEKSFEREKRFSSDVAHELRTPISELRTLADLAEKWPDDAELVNDCVKGSKDVAIKMEFLVNQLLRLARHEDRIVNTSLAPTNIVDSINLALDQLKHGFSGKSLVLQIAKNANALLCPQEWNLILINLLQNAIRYSSNSDGICIEWKTNSNLLASLVISNPSTELNQDDLPFLFQRFWRKDPSRNSDKNNGLGLPLVKALCQEMDIKLDVHLIDNIFSITISNIKIVTTNNR